MANNMSVASPVPSEILAIVALLVVSLGILSILRYYLPLRSTPAYVLLPIFFALWLPASIILLVPIDLASSAATNNEGARGIWFPPRLLLVSWRITYWLTFVLTWFILPILGEYSDAGYREPKDRLMYSLHSNAQYYMMVAGASIIGLLYVFVSYGISFVSLKGLVMALAYCWGLVLAIYLMGHGLVAIPRMLIRNGSITGRLRRLQEQAPRIYENMEDAVTNLDDLEVRVSELSKRKTGSARDFQEWIEELADICNMPEERPTAASSNPTMRATLDGTSLPTVITEKYLADLTRQLVRARHARTRHVQAWDRLVREAGRSQAIVDSAGSQMLDFGNVNPDVSFFERFTLLNPYTRYLLHFHFIPLLSYIAGGVLALASICIVWSEMIKAALPRLSVIRLSVVHYWAEGEGKGRVGFAGQIIAALWILYMCAAALTSITEVRVWRGRALVRRNTAHESAFWYASQVARLSVPLAYNFMTFLSPNIYMKTMFYNFLGILIDLTALGKWFDYLFPIFVLVPVCATLFGLYGKVRRFVGFDVELVDDDETSPRSFGTNSWREGRDLIERELQGTSISAGQRGHLTFSHPAGTRAQPVLSIPSARGSANGSVTTPFATSPGYQDNAGPVRTRQARSNMMDPSDEDDNIFATLGHRFKNTIDTMDKPKWLQELGEGFKKPKWMGGDDDVGGSSRDGSAGQNWFGGEGRIRL